MPRLSASETPTTCEVNPGLTNSPLRPVSGWMRTTGCSTGGSSVTTLAVPLVAAPGMAPQVGAPLAVAVVHRDQVVHEPADRRGERLVGELGVGPAGVATGVRQRHRPQDRRRRWGGHERDVGVPDVGEGELRVTAVDAVDLGATGRGLGHRVTAVSSPSRDAKVTWASSVRRCPRKNSTLCSSSARGCRAPVRRRGRRGRRRARRRRSGPSGSSRRAAEASGRSAAGLPRRNPGVAEREVDMDGVRSVERTRVSEQSITY